MLSDLSSFNDPPNVETLIARWRHRVTTTLLWVMSGLGTVMLMAYLPSLLLVNAHGIIVFSCLILLSDIAMAWQSELPLRLRASWASGNLALAGMLPMLINGDRGAIVGLLLGAVFTATLLINWQIGVGLLSLYTLLIAGTAWAYNEGWLPPTASLSTDWNSPSGWLGLWGVLIFVAMLGIIATELIFQQLRSSLQNQMRTVQEHKRALQELISEREQRAALTTQMLEAKAAQEKLERALHETLSAVHAGFWETDLRIGHTTWSDGMYPLLGYKKSKDKPSLELWRLRVIPEDYDRAMSVTLAPHLTQEYQIQHPELGLRWLRSAMHTIFDAQGTAILLRGIVTDITEERKTAKQLSQLAEVASRTGNAVVITDLNGRIEWVNEAFTRLTEWTAAEVIGRRPGDFLQGPHTDPQTKATMRAALLKKEPFYVEILNYSRSGKQYWLQIETRLAFDETGTPSGFIAVETDITNRRVAESREALAQRIAALLLTSDTTAAAASKIMQELVNELDIRVAQMWLVEPGNPYLVWLAGASSVVTGSAGEAFIKRSQELKFTKGTEWAVGVGSPGVAWGTQKSFLLKNFSMTDPTGKLSRRVMAAEAAGFYTFCTTPILDTDGVLGVIEIGGTSFYPGSELIPSLIERVAEQLASFMLREVNRRAFEAVFAHSPDGLLLIGEDGHITGANARAADLFGPTIDTNIDRFLETGANLVRETLHSQLSPKVEIPRLHNLNANGIKGTFSAEVSVAAAPSTRQMVILSVRDLTERHQMEAALTRSLREKETLLREVHHRVKNNLQIVSSLLTLQSDVLEPGEARNALSEMVYRVRSMSFVHQQLYSTEHLDFVNIADYTRTLSISLQRSLDPHARISFALSPVDVSIDIAVPTGLILNELITNALKHGRSANGQCLIHIALEREGEGFNLMIRDQGRGMPEGVDSSNSLGMRLIRTLARQLHGNVQINSENGCQITLRVSQTSTQNTARPTS